MKTKIRRQMFEFKLTKPKKMPEINPASLNITLIHVSPLTTHSYH